MVITPNNFPIIRGIGQVAWFDFAPNIHLLRLGESDGSLKTGTVSTKPLDKRQATSCRLELNEVFIMYPQHANSIPYPKIIATTKCTFFIFYFC